VGSQRRWTSYARPGRPIPIHDELLDQQDAVISQLDELLLKIEAVLKVAVVATSEELVEGPAEQDALKRAA
jgi:hypothetical protein